MELKTLEGDLLMSVSELKRDGDNLVIEGRIMEAIPIRAVLSPGQARSAFSLLSFKTVLFLLVMLFKSDKQVVGE